jgi:hypothetical protein
MGGRTIEPFAQLPRGSALGILLMISACSSGSDGKSGDPCAALRDCCANLAGVEETSCNQIVDRAAAAGECKSATTQIAGCNPGSLPDGAATSFDLRGADGAATSFDLGAFDLGGGGGSAQPAVCAKYVACAIAAAPGGAAAILAAYGPSGTCWNETPAVANECVTACQNGIVGLHPSEPTACPLCASDADCSSAKPACDASKGECVECTGNSYCSSDRPICRNDACDYGCLDDAQCTSSANRCDTTTNSCVECLVASDCAGNPSGFGCDASTHQCGCGLLFSLSGPQCPAGQICEGTLSGFCCQPDCTNLECGKANPGCGSDNDYACGTCSGKAVCNQGVCNTFGQECTPGGSDCQAGQVCLYEKIAQKHVCLLSRALGASCPQANVAICDVAAGSSDAFACPGNTNVCDPYCLVDGDCPSGTCHPFVMATISPTYPGICY